MSRSGAAVSAGSSSAPATLTYNSDGTLATASTPGSTIDQITYDGQGRLATYRENGTTRTVAYDPSTGAMTGVS